MHYNRTNGYFFIIGGIILLLLSASELLIRLVLVIVALAMINYGLQLNGEPPLRMLFQRLRNNFWF